jgi:hypothetical protein
MATSRNGHGNHAHPAHPPRPARRVEAELVDESDTDDMDAGSPLPVTPARAIVGALSLPGDSLHIPASNAAGATHKVQFNMPPEFARALEVISQSNDPKFASFQTASDVHRFCVYAGLSQLKIARVSPGVWSQLSAMMEIVKSAEMEAKWIDNLQRMDALVSKMCQSSVSGGAQEAARMILRVLAEVNRMPDGYMKRECKNQIQARFGHILRNAPKASWTRLAAADNEGGGE